MKKVLTIAFALMCASALVLQAQDATNAPAAAPATHMKKLTPEQQAVMTEMLAKYDTNHDGKLDKTERKAITPEDKAKMAAVGLGPKKKKAPPTDSSTSTNAPAAN